MKRRAVTAGGAACSFSWWSGVQLQMVERRAVRARGVQYHLTDMTTFVIDVAIGNGLAYRTFHSPISDHIYTALLSMYS